MNFLLIRHAEAVPIEEVPSLDDEDRSLTETGRAQCQALATALKRLGLPLGKLLTSPLVRATQTAELLRDHLQQPDLELEVCEALRPGGKFKKLNRCLRMQEASTVTLVGHNPDISLLAAWLIGSKKAQVELAKAGAAYIHSEAGPGKGAGELLWMVTPAWCQV